MSRKKPKAQKKITLLEEETLLTVFRFRQLSHSLLVKSLLTVKPMRGSYFAINLYKNVSNLEKLGFLKSSSFGSFPVCKYCYLTNKGLQYVYGILNLKLGDFNDGFKSEGFFEYEIYYPPQKFIDHHMLVTEVLVELERLSDEYEYCYEIKWRHNLYCSRKFEVGGRRWTLKADAEFSTPNGYGFIEADRGTEDSNDLFEKFSLYSKYFEHLQAEGQVLPSTILFIYKTTEQWAFRMRSNTILNAFYKVLSKWTDKVNLIIIEDPKHVRDLVRSEYEKKSRFESMRTLAGLRNKSHKEIKWNIIYTNVNNEIIIHQRCDFVDSATFLVLYKLCAQAISQNINIQIVLYTLFIKPFKFNFTGLDFLNEKMRSILAEAKWVEINDGLVTYYDSNLRI